MIAAKSMQVVQIIKKLRLHRYVFAGTINTAIGLAVIMVAFRLTQSPIVTIGISASTGYLYSLLTYHYLAFDGKGLRPPYKRYAIIFGAAFILNTTGTAILLKHIHSFANVQILILPLIIIIQWAASRLWVFKK